MNLLRRLFGRRNKRVTVKPQYTERDKGRARRIVEHEVAAALKRQRGG